MADDTRLDARFTLANERTYLAWTRLSLALIAAGLAAGQALHFDSNAVRLLVAVPPIVLGAALAAIARRRLHAIDEAMRRGEPLVLDGPYPLLTGGLVVIGAVALVIVVVDAI